MAAVPSVPWVERPLRRSGTNDSSHTRTLSTVAETDHSTLAQQDGALVERVRAGDTQAYNLLVRRHLGAAHGLARRIVGGSYDDADDVVQEAFITVLQRIDDLADPTRFRAWFLTIVRNRAHNFRDYQAVRAGPSLDDIPAVSGGEDPARQVERSELQSELMAAMENLTDLQRAVFRRYDLEGWDHAEIAEELGISRGSSRFHLHVARKAVRKHLSAYPMAWSR